MASPTTTEPVALAGSVQVLILATIAVLRVFNVWSPTDEQQAALITLYAAFVAVLTYFLRKKVTPVI